jgi:murein L,D-transpeptidase YcbB/YkuD
MTRSRNPNTRRRARRVFMAVIGWSAVLTAASLPAQSLDRAAPDAVTAAIQDANAPREVEAFYRARAYRPLWIRDGAIGPEAEAVVRLIETSDLDGLDPDDYRPRALVAALNRAASGSPQALAKAELLLSRRFAELARDMRRPRHVGVVYADAQLAPRTATMREMLEGAASAGSLSAHLDDVAWMNPVYGGMRAAALRGGDAAGDRLIRLNLDRARALPADPGRRYVVVDAVSARLWMYEGRQVRGTMRVVVGKPSEPTPMMAGLIRYASINPYWNIPPDLVRLRVAPGAIAQGPSFLKAKRFEALSDWSDKARVVDPASIDWRAVEAGRVEARVRQLPGPANAMGRIKFMFPNNLGIYLHDTPEKALLRENDRLFSSGCVRVEDAPRLARWLFGKPVALRTKVPERRVDLPEPVPVYITYLTAAAEGEGLVFRPDVYGRDRARAGGREVAVR